MEWDWIRLLWLASAVIISTAISLIVSTRINKNEICHLRKDIKRVETATADLKKGIYDEHGEHIHITRTQCGRNQVACSALLMQKMDNIASLIVKKNGNGDLSGLLKETRDVLLEIKKLLPTTP